MSSPTATPTTASVSPASNTNEFYDRPGWATLPLWWGTLLRGSFDLTIEWWRQHTLPHSGLVLDMGNGTGRFTEILRSWGFDALGVTESPNWHARQCRRGVHSLLADYTATGLPAAFADVIIFNESFCHEPPAKTLAECHRLLRPGGRLIIKDVAPTEPQRPWIASEDALWCTQLATHAEIFAACAQQGFRIDKYWLLNKPEWSTAHGASFIAEHMPELAKTQIGQMPFYALIAYKEGRT